MISLLMSLTGIVMLGAGVIGLWFVGSALRNEGPHGMLFLLGLVAAIVAYLTLTAAMIFNTAPWFGTALKCAPVLYLIGIVLQRRGRRTP